RRPGLADATRTAYDRDPRTIPVETEHAMRRTSCAVNVILFATCLAATLASPEVARGQGNLTLYCGPQIEWCQLMIAEFTKATGSKVAMTRKSWGETLAQIKAEAGNPKGGVWWGGIGGPHLQAAEEGLTEAYRSGRLGELQEWATAQARGGRYRTVG